MSFSMSMRVAVALAAFACVTAVNAGESKGRVPLPNVVIHKGEQCVEPTEDMRRNHMKYILHQRDDTVHQGIRTSKHSLKNCVNCHADPQTGSVLGKNGFCESCHTYAAVKMDCFGCHTHKAEKNVGLAVDPTQPLLHQLVNGATLSAPSIGAAP